MLSHSQNPGQRVSVTNNFDSLRLIFAILVILSHSFPLTRGSNDTEPLMRLTHGQITLGNISVWAFFVISGFLITQSWQRTPKVVKYLKRRIGRIYPGFAVAGLKHEGFLPAAQESAPGRPDSNTQMRPTAASLNMAESTEVNAKVAAEPLRLAISDISQQRVDRPQPHVSQRGIL